MKHQSIARRCAAVTAAVALVLGAGSLMAPADAAKAKPLKGSLTGAVTFDCSAAGAEFNAACVVAGLKELPENPVGPIR